MISLLVLLTVSFALMERLGITEAFAFDEHSKQYGTFIVLPLEQGVPALVSGDKVRGPVVFTEMLNPLPLALVTH